MSDRNDSQSTESVLGPTLCFKGDVCAPNVALVEGARFKGKIDMGSKKAD